jgi:hypothetical protein
MPHKSGGQHLHYSSRQPTPTRKPHAPILANYIDNMIDRRGSILEDSVVPLEPQGSQDEHDSRVGDSSIRRRQPLKVTFDSMHVTFELVELLFT